MRPSEFDLATFKHLHGKNSYIVDAPDPDQDTFFRLQVYATKPITVWLCGHETKVPVAVTDRYIGSSRVVGLRCLEFTAAKNTVISYSLQMAPVRGSEYVDPEPVVIDAPDPFELAEQERIKHAVEKELLRLGIDPADMVEDEISDDEAWDNEDDDFMPPDPFDDELLESEPELPETVSDDDQSDDSSPDLGSGSDDQPEIEKSAAD